MKPPKVGNMVITALEIPVAVRAIAVWVGENGTVFELHPEERERVPEHKIELLRGIAEHYSKQSWQGRWVFWLGAAHYNQVVEY